MLLLAPYGRSAAINDWLSFRACRSFVFVFFCAHRAKGTEEEQPSLLALSSSSLSARSLGKCELESLCDVTGHGVLTSVIEVMMSFAPPKSARIPIRPKNRSRLQRQLCHTNFSIWYVPNNAVAWLTPREKLFKTRTLCSDWLLMASLQAGPLFLAFFPRQEIFFLRL